MIASSSNGRTADSDSVNLGSNPGEAANKTAALKRAVFYWLKAPLTHRCSSILIAHILPYNKKLPVFSNTGSFGKTVLV